MLAARRSTDQLERMRICALTHLLVLIEAGVPGVLLFARRKATSLAPGATCSGDVNQMSLWNGCTGSASLSLALIWAVTAMETCTRRRGPETSSRSRLREKVRGAFAPGIWPPWFELVAECLTSAISQVGRSNHQLERTRS